MDTKKLDKLAELLLDTGNRNNLINFKDRKASTVQVLMPAADVLFGKVENLTQFEVFDPKIIDEDDEPEEKPDSEGRESEGVENSEAKKSKEAFLAEYGRKIKRQNQMLIYSSGGNPITAVKRIDKKARQFVEETGVNVAYMVFGFVCWKESDSSGSIFRAPILLVPIRFERESAVDPYIISPAEDEVIVNPTFSYKMDAERGVKLPEYNDEGLDAYLEKVRNIVAKLQWTVTSECAIGIFSFLKINMYRDLKDNSREILSNRNVQRLLGEQLDAEEESGDEAPAVHIENPLSELHNVVDADSSQIEAIELAKSGRSFVLQGPPGTGKSQTITNIIAECLSDGKKVLFVSEKLAALNVVYDKLKRAGLSEFCLELHSHKANKKEVIKDICHAFRESKSAVSSKANAEITIKERAQWQLDAYARELHKQRAVIEKSLYELYEAYAAFNTVPDVPCEIPQLNTKSEAYMTEAASLLEQYVNYIPSIGYDYRRNTWYGYIKHDMSYQARNEVKESISSVIRFLLALIPLQKEISEKYGVRCATIDDALAWNNFFRFASTSKILTPALLDRKCFEKADAALNTLQLLSAEILDCRAIIDSVFNESVYELNGTKDNKWLTNVFGSKMSRLFDADYKGIMSNLRACKKDGKKLSYSEAVEMTERLSRYQQSMANYATVEAPIKEFLGEAYIGFESEWNYISVQMSTLKNACFNCVDFGSLKNLKELASERAVFADFHRRLNKAFAVCKEETVKHISGYFDEKIFNIRSGPCILSLARLSDCLRETDKLDNWCHFRNLLSRLDDEQLIPYLDAAISQNIEPKYIADAFQKQFYYQWIDSILSENGVLSAFNRISQDKAIHTFVEKDIEQFEINKAKIRAVLSSRRPANNTPYMGKGIMILRREEEKKRKQKSIRTLLSEAGETIQLIKPCFLMSPLSVSTFIAPGSVHFDVVVFDEASQIFPQDAVGAIYRAKQCIVVGDSRQMPPSNFFNASVEEDDSDEERGDVTDFESILDICSTSMQQLRLRWHYRSRYEQLIAFSNKNFYDGDLITFPSPKADEPGVGVDYYHVDGVFDRKTRTNYKEAEFVVDLIYQNIEKYPRRSLGVVAFSIAQQELIDKLLSQRRLTVPEKDSFFKIDGEEPFFIKNLETVQGDERDTIIFSTAYGIDAQGRLLHNFGPLNRTGGERRLNVAVTRAKCNVQLVSSMHYTDIDLKRASSEGVRLLREYLDYAENGNIALERSISVNRFEQFDSDFELEVCEYLRSKGFSVDTQVGCSGFRIDIGLKRPESSDYVLAIECDGATYHSSKNARDRDRLRQEILERMGWKFYRIWSTDWFRNKSVEQDRLLEAVNAALAKNELPRAIHNAPPSFEVPFKGTYAEKIQTQEPPAAEMSVAEPQSKNAQSDIEQQQELNAWEKFEEPISEERGFNFPQYKAVDIQALSQQYKGDDFKALIRLILWVEAPLSEDLLLKRMVSYFGREKVTSAVRKDFDDKMRGCEEYGIIRKNGFLYLKGKDIRFRMPSESLIREVRQIAPEELAWCMVYTLKRLKVLDKDELYRTIAGFCAASRTGNLIVEALDSAFELIKDLVVVENGIVFLK